jgi:large subunit ribosomal protein L10
MNQAQKEATVVNLQAHFEQSAGSYLASVAGVTCEDLTKLRRSLRPLSAKVEVVKNTLAERATKGTQAEGLQEFFIGSTAIIWADGDPIQPAKVLKKFADDNDKFVLKAAYVDGQVVGAEGVETLASMPSKDELYSMLLALINEPATQLLRMMNAPASSLVRVIAAWRDKMEGEGGAQ